MKNLYKHILWWFAFPFLAIFNATIRELVYKKPLGDLTAHQISTATGIIFFGIIFYFIFKRWRVQSTNQAMLVGLIWLGLTILFEFGFGHYVMGNSWQKLLQDYNLAAGRVWSLFLAWIPIAPYIFYKLLKTKPEK
jgi:hypothetical protein